MKSHNCKYAHLPYPERKQACEACALGSPPCKPVQEKALIVIKRPQRLGGVA